LLLPMVLKMDLYHKEILLSEKKRSSHVTEKVAETLLGYPLGNNASFIVTAGRYEFKNKVWMCLSNL